MIKEKLDITLIIKNFISDLRKESGLSAQDFGEQIGKSKYWLANIENDKTKTITKLDLLSIIKYTKKVDDATAENILNDLLSENNQQIEFILPDSDKDNKDYNKAFQDVVDDIVKGFSVIFEKVDDKEYTLKLLKRLNKNMHSDLGYSLSIFSLPWCHFSNLEREKKMEIINSIFKMIKENGHDCKDCDLCKDRKIDDDENE